MKLHSEIGKILISFLEAHLELSKVNDSQTEGKQATNLIMAINDLEELLKLNQQKIKQLTKEQHEAICQWLNKNKVTITEVAENGTTDTYFASHKFRQDFEPSEPIENQNESIKIPKDLFQKYKEDIILYGVCYLELTHNKVIRHHPLDIKLQKETIKDLKEMVCKKN